MTYSYKMLMVPASKVSVPLTVVMRTRSRVAERVLLPPPIAIVEAPSCCTNDEKDHTLVEASKRQMVAFPRKK